MTLDLDETFGTSTPVIGMVHLPPLPGAPGYDGDSDAIHRRAVRDARALETGGVDGIMVENFGDAPFYPDDVPKHVVAAMTAITSAVVDATSIPVGVNVLRNDATAALSVAAATDAAYVRVNVHTGAAVTDQGLVQGAAHETMRLRERLDCDVAVCSDVGVKHAESLGEWSLAAETEDVVERGLADAVVVSGTGTGKRTDLADLEVVRETVDATTRRPPVLVGSGVSTDTVGDLLRYADGVIVGTALKERGVTTNPVDADRVEALVQAVESV